MSNETILNETLAEQRARMEAVAKAATALAAFGSDAGLPEIPADEDPRFDRAHAALLAALGSRLFNAKTGETHESHVGSLSDEHLDRIADAAIVAVEAVCEQGAFIAAVNDVDAALLTIGAPRTGFGKLIIAARETEVALQAVGYTTPEAAWLDRAYALMTDGEPSIQTMRRADVDATISASLGFVEIIANSAKSSDDSLVFEDTLALEGCLADAGYLLPGENETRKESIASQTSRGSDQQKVAIALQAARLVESIELAGGLEKSFTIPGRGVLASAAGATRLVIGPAFDKLEGSVDRLNADGFGKIDASKPVRLIEGEQEYAFVFARKSDLAEELRGATTERECRLVLDGLTDERFNEVVKGVVVSAESDLEAVSRFHAFLAEGGDRREDVVIIDTDEKLSLTRLTDIEGGNLSLGSSATVALEAKDAEVLAKFLDSIHAIVDSAQIDTRENDHVMFNANLARDARKQIAALMTGDGLKRLREVSDAKVKAVGLTPESGTELLKLVEDVKSALELATPRGDAGDKQMGTLKMAIPEADMQSISGRSDVILHRGVYLSVAAMAGREGVSTESLLTGRDAAAFGSIAEAMGGGGGDFVQSARRIEDRALSKVDRVEPEMTTAHFQLLSANAKRRARAYHIQPKIGDKPGQGWFQGYESSPATTNGTDGAQAKRRIKAHLRSQMRDDNGRPNLALQTFLVGLKDRSIVSANLKEAQGLREFSDEIVTELQAKEAARQQKWQANAETTSIEFLRSDSERFLQVLEASGSRELPTLVKQEGIRLMHKDAPTLVARTNVDDLGPLESLREGHRLAKIDPKSMRDALESSDNDWVGLKVVLEYDRVRDFGKEAPVARPRADEKRRYESSELVL